VQLLPVTAEQLLGVLLFASVLHAAEHVLACCLLLFPAAAAAACRRC
jgi:hypothetical protein